MQDTEEDRKNKGAKEDTPPALSVGVNTRKEKSDNKDTDKEIVNPRTTGFGRMTEMGWVVVPGLTALITAAVMGATKTGGKGWRDRDAVIRGLRWPVDASKEWFSKTSFGRKHENSFNGIWVVVAAAGVAATIIKHILQAFYFRKGWKEGKRGNEQYQEVVDERDELLDKLAKYEGNAIYTEHPQAMHGSAQSPSQAAQQAAPQPATMQKPIFPAPGAVPPLGEAHMTARGTPMGNPGTVPAHLTQAAATAEHQAPPTLTGAGV